MILRPSGLVVADRRLLVMRYRYGEQDRLNLPGGNAEGGETLHEGLIREFAEELDLEVIPGEQLFTVETRAAGRQVLHLVFRIQAFSGRPCPNPQHTKSLDVQWLDGAALAAAPLYPAIGAELAAWLAGESAHPVYLGLREQPWIT